MRFDPGMDGPSDSQGEYVGDGYGGEDLNNLKRQTGTAWSA